MLFNLLKRDLRLHWDILVLPYVILALIMGAIAISNEAAAAAGGAAMGALFVPFMPLAIHLRENSQGTLVDLVALPSSRRNLVSLRYLEVLLFACVMIVLVHLGAWVAQSAAAHRFVHFGLMDQGGLSVIGMLLLICFAYPLPFTLRWNGKGLALAFGILWFLLAGSSGPGLLLPANKKALIDKAMFVSIAHLINHPGQVALGILALFAVSYLLSLKAFSSRDF
jgi:ABC-type transport system involved in multi-copper enzyme maturation permease subunit